MQRNPIKFRQYLFEPNGILGYLITIVTGCKYSHSAVGILYDDGSEDIYDASEKRGDFAREDDLDYLFKGFCKPTRKYVYYDFEGDATPVIESLEGKKYDWKGVFGWLFKSQDKSKFYCFEVNWLALEFFTKGSLDNVEYPDFLSGCTVEERCIQLNAEPTSSEFL